MPRKPHPREDTHKPRSTTHATHEHTQTTNHRPTPKTRPTTTTGTPQARMAEANDRPSARIGEGPGTTNSSRPQPGMAGNCHQDPQPGLARTTQTSETQPAVAGNRTQGPKSGLARDQRKHTATTRTPHTCRQEAEGKAIKDTRDAPHAETTTHTPARARTTHIPATPTPPPTDAPQRHKTPRKHELHGHPPAPETDTTQE